MLLQEELNVDADELAGESLHTAVREDKCMSPDLPYEQIKVIDKETGQKAIGSVSEAILKWRSRHMCKLLFSSKKLGSRIRHDQYDRIYWPGVEQAMKAFPRGFRNWVTKQVSGMCGCTGVKCRWTNNFVNKCSSCGGPNDTMTHITRCPDQER